MIIAFIGWSLSLSALPYCALVPDSLMSVHDGWQITKLRSVWFHCQLLGGANGADAVDSRRDVGKLQVVIRHLAIQVADLFVLVSLFLLQLGDRARRLRQVFLLLEQFLSLNHHLPLALLQHRQERMY